LPVGAQIIAPAMGDERMLHAAAALERVVAATAEVR
jgi:Asp-tRNA(Asn)/Glu-tRNA(Gln) amidotransferase A subunit family amidase